MSTDGNNSDSPRAAAAGPAILIDDWLSIDTDTGFAIPGRQEIVAWSEAHPRTVIVTAHVALWTSLLGVLFIR